MIKVLPKKINFGGKVLSINQELKILFPDLRVLFAGIAGVKVVKENPALERFRQELSAQVKEAYTLEQLKDVPIFRAYRDFFWRVGIDPTKTRPAGEALIRRILRGKPIPKINNLVDSYNLASIRTGIALAAFDEDRLKGGLEMRFSKDGEEFLGIGMKKEVQLKGNEIVISDEEKLVAIYPYRDADSTKITLNTKNVFLLICGVPGIEEVILKNACRRAVDYIIKFCGGEERI